MSALFDEIKNIARIHAYCVTGDERYLRDDDDYERKTYCGCDKGELTAEERATHRCQRCGKEI